VLYLTHSNVQTSQVHLVLGFIILEKALKIFQINSLQEKDLGQQLNEKN